MKCTVCKGPASIDLPRHNANFCGEHLLRFCRDQVARAVEEFEMFDTDARLLLAVSGGKDSLALWHILEELGYDVDGFYLGLGIGGYSDSSGEFVRRFAQARTGSLTELDLLDEHGYDIPGAARRSRRTPCSACGLSKRHLFDRAAVEGGYDVLVTGHNLDDEAAVLFGNVLRWQLDYLSRQRPVLPARQGLPRKAKPLVRLSERETAAYCIIAGIDYQVEECPMAAGNKHLGYKHALNEIEATSPGTKANFYLTFQKRALALFDAIGDEERRSLGTCTRCGSPSPSDVCAFCRLEQGVSVGVPGPTRARPDDTPTQDGR